MIVAALLYLYQSLTLASLEQRPVPFGAIVIGFFVYTVPTWLASRRNHERLFAIATLNVLLGWTLIGWLAALHWGLKEPHDSRESATVAAPRL
ncbi:MAG: superinfection immunity protein [Verrucomicrobiota bacterium]